MNKKLNYLLPLLFAIVLVIGLQLGFGLRESTWDKKPLSEYSELSRLDELIQLLDVKYVDTVDKKTITDDAIEKILSELDPHSFFIRAEDLKGVNENLEGNFEGIGIEFFIVKDTIMVVSPIAGGPSEQLGIMSGDKIIKIEDTLVAGIGITNRDVMGKLRGQKGTKVKVSIYRGGADELLDFVIIRDKIPLYSVDIGYMVDDEVGYIKINRFSATTYKEFLSQLEKLQASGMKKLIVDVRQNPGGYLNAATMIADEFISGRKLLVYTEGKAYQRIDYEARIDGLFEQGGLVIIIDQGSASASEILAGAVQDWDRGTIIGRRSFGKGLVQEQYDLQDSSAIRLTVARYYTPSGRSIQKPYNKGDQKDYYSEIYDRYESGEFYSEDSIHLQDSTTYETASGKEVYGSGGIIPDIFVPLDTTGHPEYFARVRRFIPQFIYDYYAQNRERHSKDDDVNQFVRGYQIDYELYERFIGFAENEGLKRDEAILKELESRIRTMLKAYLGRQIYGDEGFYPVINQLDDTFLKALDTVKSPPEKKSL